jgi:hypothetical protein
VLGLQSGDSTSRGECSVISERGSAVRTAVHGAEAGIHGDEARVPDVSAKAVLFGAECYHLAGEVVDSMQKCGVVGWWANASERRLVCILGDAVRTAGYGVQAASCWPARMAYTLVGSRLNQMLWRKSSDTSGSRLLRCLRNLDGLRSPIFSSARSWRILCSHEGDNRLTNSVLSVV